jgi:hypothetical protein
MFEVIIAWTYTLYVFLYLLCVFGFLFCLCYVVFVEFLYISCCVSCRTEMFFSAGFIFKNQLKTLSNTAQK